MSKETKYPIVKEVRLNNKSRKGNYIYVKLEKGKPASYYKKKEGLKREDYLETKVYGVVSKKRGAKQKKDIDRIVRKIRTREKIEESLSKGISTTTITNAERMSTYGIRTAYNKLLLPIVRKEKLLAEILSRQENVKKFKHRLEFQVDIIGEKNNRLATVISAHKGKMLDEVMSDIKKEIKIGMQIEGEYNLKGLKGYSVSRKGTGRVKSINVKMIFRKG